VHQLDEMQAFVEVLDAALAVDRVGLETSRDGQPVADGLLRAAITSM